MQPPLFYVPVPEREGDLLLLPKDEAKHASRVLRLKPGSLVVVVDGLGNALRGEIASNTAGRTEVRVHSEVRDLGEPSVRLTLAAGLSTRYKFDAVIQQGTELGVSRFVPVLTEKSKVTVEDDRRAKAKQTRWTKVAVAAMKQSRRSCLPQVSLPTTLADFLAQFDEEDTGLIFHPGKSAVSLDQIDLSELSRRVTLLVGPESGFSDDEIIAAETAGCKAVSLGRRVLRTETAGPVVTALVMARLGEFR